MTREEFVTEYATRSGVSLFEILQHVIPIVCHCGKPSCCGWQMIHKYSLIHYVKLGFVSEQEVLEAEMWVNNILIDHQYV